MSLLKYIVILKSAASKNDNLIFLFKIRILSFYKLNNDYRHLFHVAVLLTAGFVSFFRLVASAALHIPCWFPLDFSTEKQFLFIEILLLHLATIKS